MKVLSGKQIAAVNIVAFAVGLVPIVLFWFFFGRAPGVAVVEAKRLLNQTNSAAVLVDVRPEAAYASNHVAGAVSLPRERLATLTSARELPAALQGRKLLVICDSGLSSAMAVSQLKSLGVADVHNVSGGMQTWLAQGDIKEAGIPFRPMSRWEQLLPVFIAFGLKPVYMVMGLAWIIWLWRERAVDLAILRWGLLWFWIGENGCSIDFLFYARGSDFWEYVHGYGMAVGFSMVMYALLEGFDYRIMKFSPETERCAALNLCRTCVKYVDAPCRLKRLFMVLIPAFALLSLMPLCASLNLTSYNTSIFGTQHNYCHMISSQLFEWRFCPILALMLFAAAWLVLLFKQHEPVALSKVLFAAGLGPLSFGMLRMFFVLTFTDNLMWFDVWEEVTEFLFLLGTGVVLWLFRETLFMKKAEASATAAAVA